VDGLTSWMEYIQEDSLLDSFSKSEKGGDAYVRLWDNHDCVDSYQFVDNDV